MKAQSFKSSLNIMQIMLFIHIDLTRVKIKFSVFKLKFSMLLITKSDFKVNDV